MLIGICPYCNKKFFGMALLDPAHQKCPNCGIGRLVINDNFRPLEGDFVSTVGHLDINQANEPLAKDMHHKRKWCIFGT